MLTILTGVCIFLLITLLLVIILLVAKKYLVHSGKVKITINNDTVVEADSGKTLLSTLADQNIFLSLPAVAKVAADNASVRFTPEVATYSPQRKSTSHVKNNRTTGVSAAR